MGIAIDSTALSHFTIRTVPVLQNNNTLGQQELSNNLITTEVRGVTLPYSGQTAGHKQGL